MDFRILGPLEVIEDGQVLNLGAPMQRALLVVLLLNANRVVSSDHLIDALWPDGPTESAPKALQLYVSRLRKALGRERLETTSPGYLLRVQEGEIDADRARALAEEDRPRDALALWRGLPLSDFAYAPFAQVEIARLQELHLGCLENRLEHDLAEGRHAAVTSELEAMTAEYPLRERFRAQLMLSLYRSGRQAEALEAYQDARTALVEELGIEPSPELRDLHQAILNQNPALDAASRATHSFKDLRAADLAGDDFPPVKSLHRANLPRPATPFLGRERELQEVHELISRADVRLLTLTGPGGTGKTRLALQAAAEASEGYPGGVFWVPLAPLRDPQLVLETARQALGASNGLAKHIGDTEMLVLFDNFEHVVEAAGNLVGLLAECPRLDLLVTSREPLHVTGEQEYPVPPLTREEGTELFQARARAVEPEFKANGAVAEICQRLDDLPLAIELAAARVKAFSTAQILERLGQRLPLLTGGARDAPERQRTLRATIQWSHDLLTNEEKRLFARLAVFRGGCTLEAAEQVVDANLDTVQSLVDKSLLRHSDERFWMLETIREFALEQLEVGDELEGARRAYFAWMQRLAQEACSQLEGHGHGEWVHRLHDEHANVREVVTLALQSEDAELALNILVALDRYWYIRPGEAMGWFERALDLLDRVPPTLAAHALRVAAATAWFYGQPRLTYERCQRGLAIFEQLGDEVGISVMYSRMAPASLYEGRLDEAAELNAKAIEMHRRLGLEHELAISLQISGSIAWEQGDLEDAAQRFIESIELERRIGSLHTTTRSFVLLGALEIEQGKLEHGIAHTREGIDLAWSQQNLIDLAMLFSNLAVALAATGDERTAALYVGAADRLDDEIGPSQFRSERSFLLERLPASVVADQDTQAAGKAISTAEAVELATLEP